MLQGLSVCSEINNWLAGLDKNDLCNLNWVPGHPSNVECKKVPYTNKQFSGHQQSVREFN